MSASGDDLSAVADRLADAGEWDELYRTLDEHDTQTLLSDRTIAYRYAEALFHTGRMERLAEFAKSWEAEARERSDTSALLRAINLSGIAAFEQGSADAAARRFESLMELAEAEGSTDMMARAANGLGSVSVLKGSHEEALSYFRLAGPLYERQERIRGLAQLHHNFGICFRDLGRHDDAVGSFREATRLSESIGYEFLAGLSRAQRAEVELMKGDVDFARQLARRGLEQIRDVGDPISEAEALRVLGVAESRSGADRGEGRRHLEEALRLARRTSSTLLEGEVERDLARLLLEEGDLDEARGRLERAVALFDRAGATAYRADCRDELAALSGDAGD